MVQIPRVTLQQQFKTTNFIGLAMMAAVFLYAGIVLSIDKGFIPYQANFHIPPSIRYILLIISLVHYFIIRFFQKFSLRSVAYLPAGAIITFALCEAVAVYGLALFLLTMNSSDFFIFMLISLLYFYLFYPKFSDWEKLAIQTPAANSPK